MTIPTQIFVGDKPRPSKIDPIENVHRSKPKGGFWTCKYLDQEHYSEYIKYERGNLVSPQQIIWKLDFSDKADVLYIDSVEKLEQQPAIETEGFTYKETFLDFEQLFSEYDGIYISEDVAYKKSWSDNYGLAGWDFETYLWKDLSSVTHISKLGSVGDLVSYVN